MRDCVRRAAAALLVFVAASMPGHVGLLAQDLAELADRAWAAVEGQRYGDALDAFTMASELAPHESSLWLGRGYAAYLLGRDEEAEAALSRAVEQQPSLTDASRLLGALYHRTGRLERAIATYEAALSHAPSDRDLADRLAEWKADDRLTDRFTRARGTHFRVLFEGPTDNALARRVVGMLESAYRNVGAALRTYPAESITVMLYTEEQFQDITRAPSWSAGAYDGTIRLPVRGALDRRDELQRILTHEYVHVLVAGLGGRAVPTWVNEGLAGVLEPAGLDRASAVLASAAARPRLSQLHHGFGALSGAAASLAYAQSAVAVDKMISLRGAPAVVLLLQDLARGVSFSSAFRRRIGMRYEEFERTAANLR